MSIIKKKAKMPAKDASTPSLAVAYNASKATAKRPPSKAAMPSSSDDVDASDLMSDDERASSVADAIMKKRKVKKMSEGGMVDLESNAAESNDNDFDSLNEDASSQDDNFLKENYSEDFNTISPGHEPVDQEDDSMISKIRASMKAKRGM